MNTNKPELPQPAGISDRGISRRGLLLGAGALVIIGAVVVFLIQITTPEPPAINGLRLVTALAQYARDLRNQGAPVPRAVTLDTLVLLGYLTREDVKPFAGMQVTFYADAVDSEPQSVLMEARMPDGQVQAVLADGSVQQFSKQRWEEAMKARGLR